jgi:putative peptidoglycan lipid II flippase
LDRFALPALAPAVTPLAIIAAALLGGTRWGIWVLVDATLAGALVQAVLMAWMMNSHGYRFRLRCYAASEASREVAHQYGSVLLSSVVASGGLLADQAMAAMLTAGSVSALAYASRFVSVALTLLAGTISTALAPYFARLIAHRDWEGCRQTLKTWGRIAALVSLPIAIALIAGARPLIRIALQHGMFTARDTAVVAPVLALYAIQIPFFAVSRVFYRFLVALRRTDLVLYCGVMNLVLDVVLNLILMRWFGVAGIALATSLWTIATCLVLGYWTVKLLPKPVLQGRQDAH